MIKDIDTVYKEDILYKVDHPTCILKGNSITSYLFKDVIPSNPRLEGLALM